MPNFRRAWIPGGTYFFTLVTEGRARIFMTEDARKLLHEAFDTARTRWPFRIDAIVLLPDHLHTLWTLPDGDTDYPRRWAWIKKEFTKGWLRVGGGEQPRTRGGMRSRYAGVLQARYWEHVIRDWDDLANHAQYIHYNPVKHGLATCPHAWPFSSFHRWVRCEKYPRNWCCACDGVVARGPSLHAIEEYAGE